MCVGACACALCHARGFACGSLETVLTHLGHLQSHTVLCSQLFQLSKHAVGDAGDALGVQAVHHAAHQVNLHPMAMSDNGWVAETNVWRG